MNNTRVEKILAAVVLMLFGGIFFGIHFDSAFLGVGIMLIGMGLTATLDAATTPAKK